MNPVTLGAKFSNAAPYSTSPERLIAPADNVNGAVIRTASIHVGNLYGMLSTGVKPPTGYTDNTVPVILSVRAGDSGPGSEAVLPYEVQIPAGYGLWFVKGSTTTGIANVTYDLLP